MVSKFPLLWGLPALDMFPGIHRRAQLCWLCLSSQDSEFFCYFQVVSQLCSHQFEYYPGLPTCQTFPLAFSPQTDAWRTVQSCQNVTSTTWFLGLNNQHWIYQDFLTCIRLNTSHLYQTYEPQKLVLLLSVLTSYPCSPFSDNISSSLACDKPTLFHSSNQPIWLSKIHSLKMRGHAFLFCFFSHSTPITEKLLSPIVRIQGPPHIPKVTSVTSKKCEICFYF